MVNVFYPEERIEHRFDLKGCEVGRFTEIKNDKSICEQNLVLKEKNLAKKISFGLLNLFSSYLKKKNI